MPQIIPIFLKLIKNTHNLSLKICLDKFIHCHYDVEYLHHFYCQFLLPFPEMGDHTSEVNLIGGAFSIFIEEVCVGFCVLN